MWLESLGFLPEVRFPALSGKRRFEWDWCHDELNIAVEYQGKGVGHQGFAAVERDYEKTTEGQLCGFLVIQCSAVSARDGRCQRWVDLAIEQRSECAEVDDRGTSDRAGE